MSNFRSDANIDPRLVAPNQAVAKRVDRIEQIQTILVTDKVLRLFGQDPGRLEYVIQNQSGMPIYFGTNNNITILTASALQPWRKYKSKSKGELYVISAASTGAALFVAWESGV